MSSLHLCSLIHRSTYMSTFLFFFNHRCIHVAYMVFVIVRVGRVATGGRIGDILYNLSNKCAGLIHNV